MDSDTSTLSDLRVAFQTFGCRSNHADTADLQAALAENGAINVEIGTRADVLVVNTCSVTDSADREALKTLRKLRADHPDARIVVTGCLAEVGGAELAASGVVDAIISPGRRREILAAISTQSVASASNSATTEHPRGAAPEFSERIVRSRRDRPQSLAVFEPLSQLTPRPGIGLGDTDGRSRYHLRIQEGCDNFCTFCIIPFTRGALTSRGEDQIIRDTQTLHELGYNEVVITGTHIGGYGEDHGSSLLHLLKRLEAESPISRFRLSSIDPNDLNPELIRQISGSTKICSHLHLCAQALTNDLLKRMNRRYSMDELEQLIQDISAQLEDWCFGFDLITGFPGESIENFERQLAWFESSPVSYVHVFPYSERSGTAATLLPDSVPVGERRRRAARWRALSERKLLQFSETMLGREVEVVVERIEQGVAHGTTREYLNAECVLRDDRVVRRGDLIRSRVSQVRRTDGVLRCE